MMSIQFPYLSFQKYYNCQIRNITGVGGAEKDKDKTRKARVGKFLQIYRF